MSGIGEVMCLTLARYDGGSWGQSSRQWSVELVLVSRFLMTAFGRSVAFLANEGITNGMGYVADIHGLSHLKCVCVIVF